MLCTTEDRHHQVGRQLHPPLCANFLLLFTM